jgi:hypothetical protein
MEPELLVQLPDRKNLKTPNRSDFQSTQKITGYRPGTDCTTASANVDIPLDDLIEVDVDEENVSDCIRPLGPFTEKPYFVRGEKEKAQTIEFSLKSVFFFCLYYCFSQLLHITVWRRGD